VILYSREIRRFHRPSGDRQRKGGGIMIPPL
jgi:hypothetical protein